jgi:hypothetical protein
LGPAIVLPCASTPERRFSRESGTCLGRPVTICPSFPQSAARRGVEGFLSHRGALSAGRRAPINVQERLESKMQAQEEVQLNALQHRKLIIEDTSFDEIETSEQPGQDGTDSQENISWLEDCTDVCSDLFLSRLGAAGRRLDQTRLRKLAETVKAEHSEALELESTRAAGIARRGMLDSSANELRARTRRRVKLVQQLRPGRVACKVDSEDGGAGSLGPSAEMMLQEILNKGKAGPVDVSKNFIFDQTLLEDGPEKLVRFRKELTMRFDTIFEAWFCPSPRDTFSFPRINLSPGSPGAVSACWAFLSLFSEALCPRQGIFRS